MKKIAFVTAIMILSISLGACGGKKDSVSSSSSTGSTEPTYEYVSLLKDKNFESGFLMRGLGAPIYGDDIECFNMYDAYNPNVVFSYEKENLGTPFWNICQWATRYPFHDIENTSTEIKNGKSTFNYSFTDLGNGKYNYDNQSKKIYVDTATGELGLGLKASECYKYDRTEGQEWPHLLLSSDKLCVANAPSAQSSVKNADSIVVNLDVKLNSFSDHMIGEVNPNLHSAVCMFYAYVSYKPNNYSAFTDMIWLGLTIFDNRTAFASGMSCIDEGTKGSATGKWIYNVPTTHFFDLDNNLYDDQGNMVFDKWANVNIDIYPYIELALIDAQRGGCMMGATMDNLYINGTYIGMELPGTYDVDMSFKNFDIKSNIRVDN